MKKLDWSNSVKLRRGKTEMSYIKNPLRHSQVGFVIIQLIRFMAHAPAVTAASVSAGTC